MRLNFSFYAHSHHLQAARAGKLTSGVEQLSLNGGMVIDMATLTNKTLYTSPYMVITDQEYTKHFYAGSQRIASKIGAGFDGALVDMDVNVATLNSDVESIANGLINLLEESNTCAQIESGNVTMPEPNLPIVEELRYTSINNLESDMYFYHTDHLGSSSWITDASGAVNQHLQYLPYGEDYIYQRNSSWAVPYTFSGKEKDSETGYSYFGARYYSSDLSVWLSVDPLADKYPSTSSYMYVGGHPTKLIDPNGMDWYQDADGNYVNDKNVTKDTKLGEGEKYLGKSKEIKVNDIEGNYSYSYNLNEDGSFSDTRGNQHEAGSGEFDPGFKSGHKINSKDPDKPSDYMINLAQMLTLPYPNNPFAGAVAISSGGTGELVGAEGGGGWFFILAGDDIGKVMGYGEYAGGLSSDAFLGANIGRVDYSGNPNDFKAYMLYGDRHKAWLGVGEGFSGGFSGAWSNVPGGWIITTEFNAGAGASLFLLGGGYNFGTISR